MIRPLTSQGRYARVRETDAFGLFRQAPRPWGLKAAKRMISPRDHHDRHDQQGEQKPADGSQCPTCMPPDNGGHTLGCADHAERFDAPVLAGRVRDQVVEPSARSPRSRTVDEAARERRP